MPIISYSRGEPFKVEPNGLGDSPLRGAFRLGTKEIGFIWDAQRRLLFIDINGDLDLTNDPNNVWRPDNITRLDPSGEAFEFEGIRIPGADPNNPMLLGATIRQYGRDLYSSRFWVAAWLEGQLQIDGCRTIWRIAHADLDGRPDRFSISFDTDTPWSSRMLQIPNSGIPEGQKLQADPRQATYPADRAAGRAYGQASH
jgi:hypothetical protein